MDPTLRPTAERIIQAGFRAVAKSAHPDAGGTTEEMQLVNAATAALRRVVGEDGATEPSPDFDLTPCEGTIQGRVQPCVALHNVRAMAETDKALLVKVDGESMWFPFSHIADESDVETLGQEGDLIVSTWIAEQKGLL